MSPNTCRLPAEWEPQAAVLIAWPHAGTDWAPRLAAVESTYLTLAAHIARFETLIICTPGADVRERAKRTLASRNVDLERVRFVDVPYNDTWLRDSGPITLRDSAGKMLLQDFRFTGWGGKFAADSDDALTAALVETGLFGDARYQRIDWALEGGAVESDGAGSILSTWQCMHLRHPHLDRDALTRTLCRHLHATRVMWLDHGYLQGDDTDAHIDTLARLAPDDGIVFQACDDADDPHCAILGYMRDELESLRTLAGDRYRLHALPWSRPVVDEGRRLAASYANYLVLNDAVLVPAYDDPADGAAAEVVAAAHPGREVVSIPCRPLIWQNGSLHCITMQLPHGMV